MPLNKKDTSKQESIITFPLAVELAEIPDNLKKYLLTSSNDEALICLNIVIEQEFSVEYEYLICVVRRSIEKGVKMRAINHM